MATTLLSLRLVVSCGPIFAATRGPGSIPLGTSTKSVQLMNAGKAMPDALMILMGTARRKEKVKW